MTRIALTSESKIKIDALKLFIKNIMQIEKYQLDTVRNPDQELFNLPSQPLNDGGAEACLERLKFIKNVVDYDYIFSIENYISEKTEHDYCYCIIQSGEKKYYGISDGIECLQKDILKKVFAQERGQYCCEGVEKTYGEFLQETHPYINPNNWMKFQGKDKDRGKQIEGALFKAYSKMMLDRIVIRHKDFPKKGVIFQDLMPLFKDPNLYNTLISIIANEIEINLGTEIKKINYIIGPELRGCMFGILLARELNCGFIPIRKDGKLPGPIFKATYDKEYGKDTLTISYRGMDMEQNVIIIDDLIATGGSMESCIKLCKYNGYNILDCIVLKDVPELREKYLARMEKLGIKVRVIL